MTDKIGPALALAVARVMGRNAEHGIERDIGGHRVVFPWRPDLGGAAGAEALEWLTSKCVISFQDRGESVCKVSWHDKPADRIRVEHGPTIWIALCRAIVAYGESR